MCEWSEIRYSEEDLREQRRLKNMQTKVLRIVKEIDAANDKELMQKSLDRILDELIVFDEGKKTWRVVDTDPIEEDNDEDFEEDDDSGHIFSSDNVLCLSNTPYVGSAYSTAMDLSQYISFALLNAKKMSCALDGVVEWYNEKCVAVSRKYALANFSGLVDTSTWARIEAEKDTLKFLRTYLVDDVPDVADRLTKIDVDDVEESSQAPTGQPQPPATPVEGEKPNSKNEEGVPKGKPGRKTKPFKDVVVGENSWVVDRLHELIDDKTDSSAVLYIAAACDLGLITQPTYTQFVNEFRKIASRQIYNIYVTPQKWPKTNLNSAKAALDNS